LGDCGIRGALRDLEIMHRGILGGTLQDLRLDARGIFGAKGMPPEDSHPHDIAHYCDASNSVHIFRARILRDT